MIPYLIDANVAVSSRDPTAVSVSRSGKKLSRNLEQQVWLFSVEWPDLLHSKAAVLEVALDEMKGQMLTAQVFHPVRSYHPNASGAWHVSIAASAGEKLVSLAGVGELSIGHFIVFSGHSKAYRVMKYENNVATVYPSLREGLNSDTAIIQDVPFTVTRTDDETNYPTSGPIVSISAEFEEQLF